MIEVVWGLITGGSKDDTIIVTVTPQLDNKWYKSEISFFANSSNYAVIMFFFVGVSETIFLSVIFSLNSNYVEKMEMIVPNFILHSMIY